MYCGQCGKKVMENMLFCPFCGAAIVIPDQDGTRGAEPEAAPSAGSMPAAEATRSAEVPMRPRHGGAPSGSLFADAPAAGETAAPEEKFVPLFFDFDAETAAADANAEQSPEPTPEPDSLPDEPDEPDKPGETGEMDGRSAGAEAQTAAPEIEDVPRDSIDWPPRRTPGRRPQPISNETGARRSKTYIPVKELDPEDLFLEPSEEEDDYDAEPEEDFAPDSFSEDDFEYEEPEHGGFFQRHIRGIVGLLLLLVLVVITLTWAFTGKGQTALARINLAWTAAPYAGLGYESYQQGSPALAASYYEKALAREPDNYEYAHSAMVAYYEADNIASAASMSKKCISLQPNNPEPYAELLTLYPDADTRPWEITELIRSGYQATGDARLKLD